MVLHKHSKQNNNKNNDNGRRSSSKKYKIRMNLINNNFINLIDNNRINDNYVYNRNRAFGATTVSCFYIRKDKYLIYVL